MATKLGVLFYDSIAARIMQQYIFNDPVCGQANFVEASLVHLSFAS